MASRRVETGEWNCLLCTAALFRDEPDEDSPKKQRPRPQNKNTTAHFPESADNGIGGEVVISGIHVGMAWIMWQVAARRRSGQVLIVLMDGQASLWETMKLHVNFGARTIPILDILHALAYVSGGRQVYSRRRTPLDELSPVSDC